MTMNEQQLRKLRQLAKDVHLPKEVERRVLEETSTPKRPRRRHRPQRPITRRTFLRAGAIAAGALAAFLGTSTLLGGEKRDATEGNWFVLTAYAEGVPCAENTVIARQAISLAGSLGGSTSSGWCAAHGIDLHVTGTGIESITYSIEGNYVSPEGQGGEVFDENRVWIDAIDAAYYATGKSSPETDANFTRFTLPYDEIENDGKLWNRQIWTAFPTDDEIDASQQHYEQIRNSPEADDTALLRANNDRRLVLERRSAELLAATTFVLTVAFKDGTTQTKRYAIAPRDDFDEVYGSFLDAEAEGVYGDWPDLYTITELNS